jgi:hypothetical protein
MKPILSRDIVNKSLPISSENAMKNRFILGGTLLYL